MNGVLAEIVANKSDVRLTNATDDARLISGATTSTSAIL